MNQTMLVIGGSTPGGIGEAVVRQANYLGIQPFVPDIDELDVRNTSSIEKYVEENGPFGHTVYCAGVQYLGMLTALDIKDIGTIFDVNVIGFINVLSVLSKRQDGGRVVAISSLAGRVPMTGSIGYCASKAALNHAVRCAARELKDRWQITAIVPATVADTPLTDSVDQQVMTIRGWSRDELMAQERIRQPFGRRILKMEIAQLVMDILDGPGTLTGSVIDLTGGA